MLSFPSSVAIRFLRVNHRIKVAIHCWGNREPSDTASVRLKACDILGKEGLYTLEFKR